MNEEDKRSLDLINTFNKSICERVFILSQKEPAQVAYSVIMELISDLIGFLSYSCSRNPENRNDILLKLDDLTNKLNTTIKNRIINMKDEDMKRFVWLD